MTIGERVKELRKQVNLTQQAFADRLNLKRNTVGSYEVNVVEPSDRTISDICREFNVNETWLRTGEGEMFNQITQSEKLAAFLADITANEEDSFKRQFVEVLAELEPEDWKFLERMARKLQKKEGNP
jgi:transcriptional regulator with XRE-family HTH domain